MDKRKEIRELIASLNSLSYDDDHSLDVYLIQAKKTIRELFGNYNAYLTCLNCIRFHSTSPLISIEENVRFWARAKREMRDVLYVMLDDPLLVEQKQEINGIITIAGKIKQYSYHELNNIIQKNIPTAADHLQSSIAVELEKEDLHIHSETPKPAGPRIMDKIRIDLRDIFILERKDNEAVQKTSPLPTVQSGSGGILFFPSPNIPRSNDILSHLRHMGIAIVEGEPLTPTGPSVQEQLLMYPRIIAVIVVLNDDYFICPRVQVERTNSYGPAPTVCFSLGFLVGKLGRKRVVVFHPDDENFKRPTNYFDAVYIAHDKTGSWKKETTAYFRELWFALDEVPKQSLS